MLRPKVIWAILTRCREACGNNDATETGSAADEAQVIFRGLCPACNPEIVPGVVMA